MIYFPDSLVAVELAAGRPLSNPRVGYQSFAADLDASAVTVSGETTDGPRDAPLSPDTFQFWEPDSMPATWEVDFGASRLIDYVGIGAHTLGTSGTSVLVETNNDDVEGSPPELVWSEFGMPTTGGADQVDDSAIMLLDARRNVRRVRITLSGSEIPRICVIYAGLSLAMAEPQRGGGHAPLTMGRQTELTRQLSRGGQFLAQGVRRMGYVGSASFQNLESDWVRSDLMPFVIAAESRPFFYAWRGEDYPDEVAYAEATAPIRPQYSGVLDWFNVTWDMVGYLHE